MYKLLEDDVARFLATSDRMEGLKISFWGLISADSRNKETNKQSYTVSKELWHPLHKLTQLLNKNLWWWKKFMMMITWFITFKELHVNFWSLLYWGQTSGCEIVKQQNVRTLLVVILFLCECVGVGGSGDKSYSMVTVIIWQNKY